MSKSYILAFCLTLSMASASALPKGSSVISRATCWSGEIHHPCNGATTGCTPDGIMVRLSRTTTKAQNVPVFANWLDFQVKCQETSDAMIYADTCGLGDQGKGTCTYDASCNASCGAQSTYQTNDRTDTRGQFEKFGDCETNNFGLLVFS